MPRFVQDRIMGEDQAIGNSPAYAGQLSYKHIVKLPREDLRIGV